MASGTNCLNESTNSARALRTQFILLTVSTPIIHAVTAIGNIAFRALRLVSFYHFWKPADEHTTKWTRLKDAGDDIKNLILTPFAYVGLELSAMVGIYNCDVGKRLYSRIECDIYDNHLLSSLWCEQQNLPTPKMLSPKIQSSDSQWE